MARRRVAGSLERTGYSSYLHDAGDGRIIGGGEQVGADNEPDGVQGSLFDVSDPAAPHRTGHVVRQGTGGGEQLDPHNGGLTSIQNTPFPASGLTTCAVAGANGAYGHPNQIINP